MITSCTMVREKECIYGTLYMYNYRIPGTRVDVLKAAIMVTDLHETYMYFCFKFMMVFNIPLNISVSHAISLVQFVK